MWEQLGCRIPTPFFQTAEGTVEGRGGERWKRERGGKVNVGGSAWVACMLLGVGGREGGSLMGRIFRSAFRTRLSMGRW